MKNNLMGNGFREVLLKQIKEYLDGEITKEEYYEMAEPFYSEYAKTYENPAFHKYFLDTVADACTIYIDEPGLMPRQKDELFRRSLNEAYINLQKL